MMKDTSYSKIPSNYVYVRQTVLAATLVSGGSHTTVFRQMLFFLRHCI